jgi:hypothetical protein
MKRSDYRFGLTSDQWEKAKRQLRQAILAAAWERRMTHYAEVARAVTVTPVEPHSGLMNYLLGEIFEDEHAAGRPALTSIVTHKDGDKEPGPGFYDQARSLGYRFDEPFVYWSTQVQAVFKEHGHPVRRPRLPG